MQNPVGSACVSWTWRSENWQEPTWASDFRVPGRVRKPIPEGMRPLQERQGRIWRIVPVAGVRRGRVRGSALTSERFQLGFDSGGNAAREWNAGSWKHWATSKRLTPNLF